MRWRAIIAAIFIFASLVWLCGLVLNWHAARPNAAIPSSPSPEGSADNERGKDSLAVASTSQPVVRDSQNPPPRPLVLGWQEQRDALLKSDASSDEKADQLLATLPTLAAADQEDAAKHLVNLLSDDRFGAAAAWLTNVQSAESVQTILMNDLLNRPEKVKLPCYLALARIEDHPRAQDAKRLLSLHFTEDFGANWSAWEAAVHARLQTGP
jgi:hypothetical protein